MANAQIPSVPRLPMIQANYTQKGDRLFKKEASSNKDEIVYGGQKK